MPRRKSAYLKKENLALFASSSLVKGKKLFESGAVEVTYCDLLGGEIHANVVDGGEKHGVRLDFRGENLKRAKCSCPDAENHCRHEAAVLFAIAQRQGEEGMSYAKLAYESFTQGELPTLYKTADKSDHDHSYLDQAFAKFASYYNDQVWGEQDAMSALSAIFDVASYLGFGDEDSGAYAVKKVEALDFAPQKASTVYDAIFVHLSATAKLGFAKATFLSPYFADMAEERFNAGLSNGRSYDFLYLFAGREEGILPVLPSSSLQLLCNADFRFHAWNALANEIIARKDVEAAEAFLKNQFSVCSEESWRAMGEFLEKEGEHTLSLSAYKRNFLSGSASFESVCSFYRTMSEQEKSENKESLLELSKEEGRLEATRFLVGEGRQEDLPALKLEEFVPLKEELASFDALPSLRNRVNEALSSPNPTSELTLQVLSCLEAFPELSNFLVRPELREDSYLSVASREKYIRLGKASGLLPQMGIREYR